MCERCTAIDLTVERYLALAKSLTDTMAIDAIERLVAALKGTKDSFIQK